MRTVAQALVALLVALSTAGADPAREKRADALATEGHKLLEERDYESACAKLDEAIGLAPQVVTTMLDLGTCNEHLEKYATALSWYRRARAFARNHQLAKVESTAASKVNDMAKLVTVAAISFKRTAPEGVNVTVDGYPVPEAGYDHVELDRGRHAIDATAPGYESFHSEVKVSDTEEPTVVIDLRPVPKDERDEHGGGNHRDHDRNRRDDRHDKDEDDKPDRDQGHLVRNLVIGGSAALVVSAGIVIYARGKYAQCVDGDAPLPKCADGHDGIDGANYYKNLARWGGTPLFLAGAGLLGGAAYIYFNKPKRSHDRVVWAPLVDGTQLGVTAAGRF